MIIPSDTLFFSISLKISLAGKRSVTVPENRKKLRKKNELRKRWIYYYAIIINIPKRHRHLTVFPVFILSLTNLL